MGCPGEQCRSKTLSRSFPDHLQTASDRFRTAARPLLLQERLQSARAGSAACLGDGGSACAGAGSGESVALLLFAGAVACPSNCIGDGVDAGFAGAACVTVFLLFAGGGGDGDGDGACWCSCSCS